MERKIKEDLLKWKRDSINKPFFLYGARSVGKTFSVLEFGEKFYRNVAYFNTDNNLELLNILLNEKSLEKLVSKLSLLCGESIFKDDTLIVFDNINDEKVIKNLKIFGSNENLYHVVMISSNRTLINNTRIEEFYYRGMFTMDFFEYLQNSDKTQLIDFIMDSFDTNASMPFHQMAMDAYYEYLMTGGFPEVINAKINGASDLEIEAIKQKIINLYRSEYALYDIEKCDDVIRVLPSNLLKDNKKFQYGTIRKGARSKEYDKIIELLVTNGILNRSYKISDVKSPINSMKEIDSFKLYFNDVGILYTSLFVTKARLMTDNDLRRSLIENDVANNLIRNGYGLYYYQSDGKSEITFVVQNRNGKIIPIEVFNMKLTKAKAMGLFLSKYSFTFGIRITEDNFSLKKGIKMVPLYALSCLKDI